MIGASRIVRSRADDPWLNLAAEEHMLDRIGEGEMILFVWQNARAVVIGRNQNAWKECATDAMERDGVRLARRITGGGAVFHDRGNLNFSFVARREDYDVGRQGGVILEAARMAGVEAVLSGRNDITAGGGKFSGNAFCFRREGALHHGTILVDADLDALGAYLQASKEKIRSKGVESVRARVTNLAAHSPGLTVDRMKECLEAAFAKEYGKPASVAEGFGGMDAGELERLRARNATWAWRYGEAPGFDVELEERFGWGGVQILLTLRKGAVETARVYTDALDDGLAPSISEALKGAPFRSAELAARVREAARSAPEDPARGFDGAEAAYADVADWILGKGF